jgi:hypothetical protein
MPQRESYREESKAFQMDGGGKERRGADELYSVRGVNQRNPFGIAPHPPPQKEIPLTAFAAFLCCRDPDPILVYPGSDLIFKLSNYSRNCAW